MHINLSLETILILFAILASNGIIYSLTFFNLNKPNSSENISEIRNNTKKDVLAPTLLIASNPLWLTSSESSASSETNVSQVIFDNEDEDIVEGTMTQTQNSNLSDTNEGIMSQTQNWNISSTNEGTIPSNLDQFTSLDSITILNSQTVEEWREIVLDLHELPINTPAGILQQVKFEELNILYSQDIIQYAITQTELRLIIELIPAMDLFKPEINHLILTIMAYYHL
jgi:hypothetical protein